MPRAATAECPGCHYRFPKPEMVEVIEKEYSGSPFPTKSYSYSRGKTRYDPSARVYERKGNFKIKRKKVFYCKECYEKNNSLTSGGYDLTVFFIISILVAFLIVGLWDHILEFIEIFQT